MDTLNTVNNMQAPNPAGSWPITENFMPDFRLPSTQRWPIQTSDYHDCNNELNRRSLILIFVGEYASDPTGAHTRAQSRKSSSLLQDLASRYAEVVRGTAQVLVVVRGTPEEAAQLMQHDNLPFPVLADEDGQVHRAYGAMTLDGRTASEAVFVAGRYGKIYLSRRASDGPPLPTVNGILGSLDFIESRCPECGREEL